MRSHWSLVAFTLFFQAATGSVWCMMTALFLLGEGLVGLPLNCHLMAALIAAFAGIAAAMAHLGNPLACFHALANIRSSWLSREIFIAHFFTGVLTVLFITDSFRPGEFDSLGLFVASLSGAGLLYVMTRVYRLKTVPSWNHMGTFLNFFSSSLVLGGLLFILVQDIFSAGMVTDFNGTITDISVRMAFTATALGSMIKISIMGIEFSGHKSISSRVDRVWPLFYGIGFVLGMVSLFLINTAGLKPGLFFLTAVVFVATEIGHRVRFYNDYKRIGL